MINYWFTVYFVCMFVTVWATQYNINIVCLIMFGPHTFPVWTGHSSHCSPNSKLLSYSFWFILVKVVLWIQSSILQETGDENWALCMVGEHCSAKRSRWKPWQLKFTGPLAKWILNFFPAQKSEQKYLWCCLLMKPIALLGELSFYFNFLQIISNTFILNFDK